VEGRGASRSGHGRNTAPRPRSAWQDIPWRKVARAVFKLQKRLSQASQRGDVKAVHTRQRLLWRSWYARLLATRRVTQDNRGKRSAGVDGVKALTPPQRLHLAQPWPRSLKAQPVRRVWIPNAGTMERRPLGMPTMADRAGQALAKLALEPEWEAKFEPNSYGVRPGRSCQDAIEAIHASINQQDKDVLDADSEKCFDRLCHHALVTKLHTFPTLRRAVKAWLKAGVMDGEERFPTERGAPHGGVRSPLRMNVALHGLETALTTAFPVAKDGHRWQPRVSRFAADLVVLHRDPQVIAQGKDIAARWLQAVGLAVKPRKTRIGQTLYPMKGTAGFDFLGFHIRQYPVGQSKTGQTGQGLPLGFKPLIQPSQAGQRHHHRQRQAEVRPLQTSSHEARIQRLNPLIQGWRNYHAAVAAKKTFTRMDTRLFANLRRWARRRHPNKAAWWISENYWPPREGQWTFQTTAGIRLRHHADTPIRRYTKVMGRRSPYDGDWGYWATRLGRHPETSKRWATLLKRQHGRCPWGGLDFRYGEDLAELDHLIPTSRGGKGQYTNLQLLHRHCHHAKTARDNAVGGPLAKSRTAAEPYDKKLARTVLKPSQRG
jgi:RNA-directed DNA polymerase